MKNKAAFTKILAAAGTTLVWLPFAAALVFATAHSMRSGRFMIDYLMPGELFPLIALGSGLLIWAATRAKSLVSRISWSSGTAAGTLIFSQGAAAASGLASGRIEASGPWWLLVIGLYAAYVAAAANVGAGGILLLRALNKKGDAPV